MGRNNIGWLITKGIIGILFGMILFSFSGITASFMIILFGWFVFLIGLTSIIASIVNIKKTNSWIFMIEGILGILVGVTLVFFPIIGVITLSWIFGFWLIISSFLQVIFFSAVGDTFSKILYIILGIISIAIGIYLIAFPAMGIQIIVGAMGLYAIVIGIGQLLMALSRSRLL